MSKNKIINILVFLPMLLSAHWVEISSRPILDEGETRPLYRIDVPLNWSYKLKSPSLDTKEPLAIFQGTGFFITLHNFPADKLDATIPAQAQISRWIQQFEIWKEHLAQVQPFSQSGFTGLLIEGEGVLKSESKALIGAALSLHPDFFRRLLVQEYFHPNKLSRQIRADVTIKVLGEPGEIEQQRNQILTFIQSFELIYPLPLD